MDLSHHIKQLLYTQDCVIVPNMGGFVCSHKKLEFNFHTGIVYPARKTVAFNQNLNNNDGLLANYIANKEKLGYAQALENINAWVSNLNQKLQKGETINIEGLGSFSLNSDKKILFIPFADVNFSTETYGLSALTLNKKVGSSPKKEKKVKAAPIPKVEAAPQPLTTEERPLEKEEEISIDTLPKPTIPPQRKQRKSGRALRRVFGVLFTLLLFFSLFILQDYAYHYKMEKGSMFDFGTKNHDVPNTELENIDGEEKLSPKTLDEIENSTDFSSEETSKEEEKENNSLENNTVTQTSVETSIEETAKTDSVFYIIAGAFSSESNAQDLTEELNRKGFAPEIIKVPGSSLYRVGYQRYPTRQKAEGNLNSVRNKTHNFAAWVLAVKP